MGNTFLSHKIFTIIHSGNMDLKANLICNQMLSLPFSIQLGKEKLEIRHAFLTHRQPQQSLQAEIHSQPLHVLSHHQGRLLQLPRPVHQHKLTEVMMRLLLPSYDQNCTGCHFHQMMKYLYLYPFYKQG